MHEPVLILQVLNWPQAYGSGRIYLMLHLPKLSLCVCMAGYLVKKFVGRYMKVICLYMGP